MNTKRSPCVMSVGPLTVLMVTLVLSALSIAAADNSVATQRQTDSVPAKTNALDDPNSPESRKKAADEAARGRIREKSLCLAGSDSASGVLISLYDKFRKDHTEAPMQLYYSGGSTEGEFTS